MSKKPLWTCPRCGHRFVTPHMWHACSRYSLDHHFQGKEPRLRALFDAWRGFVKQHGGPVTVIAQKTRSTFQVRVRFAGAVIRKRAVQCNLWLKRQVDSSLFDRVEKYAARDHVCYFRLIDPAQLNDEPAAYAREAYAVGCQAWPA